MKILHLDLKPNGDSHAEFRFFWDNPNVSQSRQLPLSEISELIDRSETDYYTRMPEDFAKTGRALYDWLDGSDRILQRELDKCRRDGIVLAIAASQRLAHLPWEILHDGTQFLVQRIPAPAIVPVRWVGSGKPISSYSQPQNRALNLLFMATAPRDLKPELDFEAEEGSILSATKRTPLYLEVEESGCLEELGYLVKSRERGFFDVVHLTGHATFQDGQPRFITETPYGDAEYSTAEDLARELQFKYPKLIFLSGCSTGYGRKNIPSMAEALLNSGATAVLGWGQSVRDTEATVAAATLYQGLSTGSLVTEALAETYQELLRAGARDWHLLRLYVADNLPETLVTPPRTPRRKPAPRYQRKEEFRDEKGKLRVVNREDFVGRRRQLQNCLRELKIDNEKVGVLLHGMGGWGKSAIASRLWDRFPDHEKVYWWRQIDEPKLVEELAKKLKNSEQRNALQESREELKYRLRDLFEEQTQAGEKPFLLILDDFEWNLEPRQKWYVLRPEVEKIFEALVLAMQETSSASRIIIACRYKFPHDLLKNFWVQGLKPFHNSDQQKKLNRLEHFNSQKIAQPLIDRALKLADGNPRLLEFLNDDILSQPNIEEKLSQLETHPEGWKERVVWPDLYEQIDEPLERVLSHCMVFEIPVPMVALEAVCESLSGYKEQLKQAIALGLMEISSEVEESERVYRVSRILLHIIPSIKLPEAPQVYKLYRKGWETLSQLWGTNYNRNEEQWREIFRLLFADKNNSDRFRQGFHQMLSVQFNHHSDKAFESMLINFIFDLEPKHICDQLTDFLRCQNWTEADQETAFIFYQIMILKNYPSWDYLLKNFPQKMLNKIDKLWTNYSHGKFGFSVQSKIWKDLGGNPNADYNLKSQFVDKVGWSELRTYYQKPHQINDIELHKKEGNLPFFWLCSAGWKSCRSLYDWDYILSITRLKDNDN